MVEFVIGVDGGGTHTRACIATLQGEILATAESGPSNVSTHGFKIAQREIALVIATAKLRAQVKGRAKAICLGLSGVDRPGEREPMLAWAREHFADRALIGNDCELVLAAGTPDGWGIALIAGTGSIAWAKTPDGRTARAGGWGYLIGDEGSGFDLAREGLRTATWAADGRGPHTALLDAILQHWQLASAAELVPKVYRSGLKPADLAQLAPIVIRVAETGDPVARQLLGRGARQLSHLVQILFRQLSAETNHFPLAVSGSLLLKSPTYYNLLLAELLDHQLVCDPITLVYEPVQGAIALALRAAKAD